MQEIRLDMAENGKATLELFKSAPSGTYDAVLMDIQMPLMNGCETAEAIRALKREDAKAVPIIAVTANAFASDVAKARSAGMNDHLSKPIEIEHHFERYLYKMLDILQRYLYNTIQKVPLYLGLYLLLYFIQDISRIQMSHSDGEV